MLAGDGAFHRLPRKQIQVCDALQLIRLQELSNLRH
jgi:hypothetical protein